MGRTHHRPLGLIRLAICGTIASRDDWPDCARFARTRAARWRRSPARPAGVPARDTAGRGFAAPDPRPVGRCGVAWLQDVADPVGGGPRAIGGKTLCGSAAAGRPALHRVSARATPARVGRGPVAVAGQSHGITALPPLRDLRDRHRAPVSIDASACPKAMARTIGAGGGADGPVGRGNPGRRWADSPQTVGRAPDSGLPAGTVRTWTTTERGHGRAEKRSCGGITDPAGLRDRRPGPRLSAGGMCDRERTVNGETTVGVPDFSGSRRRGARRDARAWRGHGGMEDPWHGHRDVTVRGDASRVENRHGGPNLARMRERAIGQRRRHPRQDSLARKGKTAALAPEFLAEVLAGASKEDKI